MSTDKELKANATPITLHVKLNWPKRRKVNSNFERSHVIQLFSYTMKTCHKQKYENSCIICNKRCHDLWKMIALGVKPILLEIKNPNVFMGNYSMIMGEVEQFKKMRKACDDKV